MGDKLDICIASLRYGYRLYVTTATRVLEGYIYEVGRSPYHNDFRARLVDDDGRVHYFRPMRLDCTVATID
jgi:hypothetical protein